MKSFLTRLAILLGSIRYASLLGVFSCAIGAVIMFIIGAKKTWLGLQALITGTMPSGADSGLDLAAAVTTSLFAALDSFLFGIVMLYAAYGIFALFVLNDSTEVRKQLPKHLVPSSPAELKHQVAMVVVVLLFVLFLELAWSSLAELHGKTWELLVVPAAIFLLSASLHMLSSNSNHDKS